MISLCQKGKKNWGVTEFVLEIKRIKDHSIVGALVIKCDFGFITISKNLSRIENST